MCFFRVVFFFFFFLFDLERSDKQQLCFVVGFLFLSHYYFLSHDVFCRALLRLQYMQRLDRRIIKPKSDVESTTYIITSQTVPVHLSRASDLDNISFSL